MCSLHFVVGMLWLIGVAALFNGCTTSKDNPTVPGAWTITGKTYILGSKDPIGGVVLKCAGISTVSASDGSYELRGVPQGTQVLRAEYPKAEIYSKSVEITSDLTCFVFIIMKFTNVTGYVMNAVDGPIDSAMVMLNDRIAQTDISGYYSFPKTLQGDYTLNVTHRNYLQFQTRVSLASPDTSYDVTLKREVSLEGSVGVWSYVDQSRAASSLPAWQDRERVLLRANGYDDLGVYHGGIEQNILVWYAFPGLLSNRGIELIDGSIQLFADSVPSAFGIRAFTARSSWYSTVTFLTQPVLGPMVYSDTIGKKASGSYVTVVGLNGLNQLLADFRPPRSNYGLEIKGGSTTSTAFYSTYSSKNAPRFLLKVRY